MVGCAIGILSYPDVTNLSSEKTIDGVGFLMSENEIFKVISGRRFHRYLFVNGVTEMNVCNIFLPGMIVFIF